MKEPTIAASQMFKNASNFLEAYHKCIAPLCAKYDLLPLSVDIVMFLANTPEYPTAKDICKMRFLKPSLVSYHVDNLVRDGFVERCPSETDRRQITLRLTEKSQPLVNDGRSVQQRFAESIAMGVTDEERAAFVRCMEKMDENIKRIEKFGI